MLHNIFLPAHSLLTLSYLSLSQCAFLIWCMLPMENNGSMVVYHRIIKPFVKKHESTIDEAFKTGAQLAGEATSKGKFSLMFQ